MAFIEQDVGNYIYFSYMSSQDMFRVKTRELRKRINRKCIVNMGKNIRRGLHARCVRPEGGGYVGR